MEEVLQPSVLELEYERAWSELGRAERSLTTKRSRSGRRSGVLTTSSISSSYATGQLAVSVGVALLLASQR